MAEKSLPGMQFADWTTLPSITEKMAQMAAGGPKSPLMMAAGKLLEQFNSSGQAPDGAVPAPTDMGMGQGLSTGNKSGVNPYAAPVGMGTLNYKLPMQQTAPTSLPSLGQPEANQPTTDSYTKYLFAPR